MIETTVGRSDSGAGFAPSSSISSWNLVSASFLFGLPWASRVRLPFRVTYQAARAFQYQGRAVRAIANPRKGTTGSTARTRKGLPPPHRLPPVGRGYSVPDSVPYLVVGLMGGAGFEPATS